MLFYHLFCIYPCSCYVQFREEIKLSVSVSVHFLYVWYGLMWVGGIQLVWFDVGGWDTVGMHTTLYWRYMSATYYILYPVIAFKQKDLHCKNRISFSKSIVPAYGWQSFKDTRRTYVAVFYTGTYLTKYHAIICHYCKYVVITNNKANYVDVVLTNKSNVFP